MTDKLYPQVKQQLALQGVPREDPTAQFALFTAKELDVYVTPQQLTEVISALKVGAPHRALRRIYQELDFLLASNASMDRVNTLEFTAGLLQCEYMQPIGATPSSFQALIEATATTCAAVTAFSGVTKELVAEIQRMNRNTFENEELNLLESTEDTEDTEWKPADSFVSPFTVSNEPVVSTAGNPFTILNDPRPDEPVDDPRPITSRVHTLLRDGGPLAIPEIMEQLNLSRNTVTRALSLLEGEALVSHYKEHRGMLRVRVYKVADQPSS